jgi:iron complex transport system substrate-binding protein
MIAAATLVISSGAAAHAKPERVMSLNMCTDQLVLQLLPPARIASVTYLSRTSDDALVTAEAAHVPVNYGTSEEVLAQHPDLVIAGTTSTPAVRALLKKVSIPLLEVPAAESFDDIRALTRRIGHALGEDAKAEALLRRMDATLAELKISAPARPVRVVGWDGGGNVPGPGTLFDAILTAAGGVNVAADTAQTILNGRYTSFDLEQLVALNPALVIYAASAMKRADQVNQQVQHRLIRKLFAGRQIAYPETLYRCGLPQSADAAKQLRQAMRSALGSSRWP